MSDAPKEKTVADALQEAMQAVYAVEHRYNHAIMHAEMEQSWPIVLDRATALQHRAALTRAMTLLSMEVWPALDPSKKR